MSEIILHSGEFTDRFDNNYRVTFYKKDRPVPPPVEYEIHTNYDDLEYTYDGVGPTNITVYSYEGQARLYTPSSPWFNIVQTSSEPLYDTGFYKLTYRIEITTNTGAERRLNITARIEGVSTDVCKKIIPVIQRDQYYIPPLKFTATTSGSIALDNSDNQPNVEYSMDGQTWTTWDYSAISLDAGDSVYMRGNNTNGFSHSSSSYSTFILTGNIDCEGNIMCLVDGDGETSVIPNNYCFYYLFNGCSSLTQAPSLPATTLTDYCYYAMFRDCSSLTTAPKLPANRLEDCSYIHMFNGCSSLSYVECLAVDNIQTNTDYWLSDVSETGTFKKHPNATAWDRSSRGIPYGWTVIE